MRGLGRRCSGKRLASAEKQWSNERVRELARHYGVALAIVLDTPALRTCRILEPHVPRTVAPQLDPADARAMRRNNRHANVTVADGSMANALAPLADDLEDRARALIWHDAFGTWRVRRTGGTSPADDYEAAATAFADRGPADGVLIYAVTVSRRNGVGPDGVMADLFAIAQRLGLEARYVSCPLTYRQMAFCTVELRRRPTPPEPKFPVGEPVEARWPASDRWDEGWYRGVVVRHLPDGRSVVRYDEEGQATIDYHPDEQLRKRRRTRA